MLYKINYKVPMEDNIIGLEENDKKIRGIAEFSFNDKEYKSSLSILADIVPQKKKQLKIVIKDARRKPKSGEGPELF